MTSNQRLLRVTSEPLLMIAVAAFGALLLSLAGMAFVSALLFGGVFLVCALVHVKVSQLAYRLGLGGHVRGGPGSGDE